MYSPSTNLILSNALLSFRIATSSTSGLQKAVEFMNIRPAKMFPAADKFESTDCPAGREKCVFRDVKFNLTTDAGPAETKFSRFRKSL